MLAGPPKIGKSIMAKHLRHKLNWFHLGTDDLVASLKSIIPYNNKNPLFANDQYELADINNYYAQTKAEIIMQNYITSWREVNKALIGLLNSILKHRPQNLIIEGVALLPEFFSTNFWQKYPVKYYALGNLEFTQGIKKPLTRLLIKTGWLDKLNDRALIGFGLFVETYSRVLKKQCEDRDLSFHDLQSDQFKFQIEKIESQIIDDVTVTQ